MATEKKINSRIQQKHDVAANWAKATNFIPKKGEIIIYDAEYNASGEETQAVRFKIGDGSKTVNNLPFAVIDYSSDVEALKRKVANNSTAIGVLQENTVPKTRKINNKALSSDITLGAADVGVTEAAFPGLNKTGTVTGVKMNGATKTPSSGVVDIGNVVTDVSGKQDKITSSNKLSASLVSGLATVAISGSYDDLANTQSVVTTDTVQTITSKKTFNGEVKFGNTENFQGYYIKRMIGSLGIGTRYENLDSLYKDGTYHRMWRLRFPKDSSFWGKIKITLYGGYSSFNASGVMSKSITCNFNASSIYNNVGCYDGLGVNVEQDFRISEAIWNATAGAWEVLIWQKNLSGNNSPTIMLECWTTNILNYINAFNGIAAQTVELTQSTSYSAQKASPTGGTKTVEWATLPVYENPLGEEIATMSDLSNKANLSGENTWVGTQRFEGNVYATSIGVDDYESQTGVFHADVYGIKIGQQGNTNCPIELMDDVGTSGQVLTSQGAGKTPIWKELVTLDTDQDITGNKTFTTSQSGGPKIGIYNGRLSVRSSSTSEGGIIWDTPSDNIAADFTVDENGAHLGLGVDAAADIVLNGDSGTVGRVLMSQGKNNTPIWGNVTKHGYTELTNENLNTITEAGWYRAEDGNTCANRPFASNSAFILIVEVRSSTHIRQTVYTIGGLSNTYKRYTNNGATSWFGWYTYTGINTSDQAFSGRKTFSSGINLTSSLQVNGSAGTAGQVLTSTGTGTPQWTTPSSGGNSVASVVDLTGSLIGGDAYFVFNNGEEGSFTGMIYCEYNTSAGDFEFQINDQIFSCTPASQDITLRVTIDRFYDGYAYSYYYTIISNDGLINKSGFFTDTNRDMYISTSMGSSYAQGGVGTIIKKVL